MPVRLQLNDGTVREYPVVNPVKGGFPSITKCGAKDCEHLDCALDLARNLKGTFQSLVWGTVALAVLMIIAFLMLNFLFGRGIASVDLPDLLLIIAPVILILVVYFSSGKRLERHSAAVKELEEYTGYRTINGIPAHQILTAPAAVTGVKPVPPGTRPGILGEMFRTSLVTDLFGNTEYEFRLLQKEPFVHAVRFFAVLLAIFSVLSIITSNLMASFPVFYSWTGRTLDSGPVSLFIHFLGLFAFSFLLVFLNGAWLHVWVFLFGGRSGMRETLRLVLYGSMPALLIGWIPEVGSFIGGLLSLGLYYHGITVFHSLSHGRSGGAVIAYVIGTIVLFSAVLLALLRFVPIAR